MDNVKKLFVQALIEAENKEISKLKGEDEIEWEFSEKFENSMNKLIRKNNHIRQNRQKRLACRNYSFNCGVFRSYERFGYKRADC